MTNQTIASERKVTVSTPSSNWDELFETLCASRKIVSLVVTGGGAGAITRCFRRAGASKNFVEAVIPYSRAAVADYLGCQIADASASGAVARQLANVAFKRACRLSDNITDLHQIAGIALTAALPTKPGRRGPDRIHVALRTLERHVLWSLELAKNSHTRESAESVADEMVYTALAEWSVSNANDRFFADAGLHPVRVCLDT